MPANLENSTVATGLEKLFSFQSQRRAKSKNIQTTVQLNSFDMLTRLYSKSFKLELPDVQAGFRKVRGNRDQIANIHWIIEKAREFQKNIYFCFVDHAKSFDSVDHNKLWKIHKEIGIPDHPTCLLRNLYAGHEATVTWNNRLVQNWGRSTSRLYIVIPLI